MITVETFRAVLENSKDLEEIERQLEEFTKPRKMRLNHNSGLTTVPPGITETTYPSGYVYYKQSLNSIDLEPIIEALKCEGIETIEEFETTFQAIKVKLLPFVLELLRVMGRPIGVQQYSLVLTYLPVLVAAYKGKDKDYLVDAVQRNVYLIQTIEQQRQLSSILNSIVKHND
jgi:hypothetical protein